MLGALATMPSSLFAQRSDLQQKAERNLSIFFSTYHNDAATFSHQPRMQKLSIDNQRQTVTVTTDATFAQQPFTDKTVDKIYKKVKKALPKPINKYALRVETNGMPIEYLIPNYKLEEDEGHALWGRIDYLGHPWVSNASAPVYFTHGLEGRHLTLWASHGRYYNNQTGKWLWQRPLLFGTTEDLFTQTIVVPFLIPMLEKAGAVVFTPRERNWQTREYIVDPDGGLNSKSSDYREYSEQSAWTTTGQRGFAAHNGYYLDNESPFTAGQARQIKTTKKAGRAFAKWQPNFEETSDYAVYVSYQSLPKSVDDAHYMVIHQGIATEFTVNQQMGGGTWTYLGTFTFDKGSSIDNCVMLTNQSHSKGIITADAVRFGGGMGNIARGGTTSGYPRALEGARYAAQWAGAPYSVYGGRNGTDDYSDDINTRSLMSNWLSGGSVYNPTQDGKKVPIELSLAVHSDAGYSKDGQSIVGSLAICTTDFNDGRLSSGVTRQASKMLASELLNNVTNDLSYKYKNWAKRYLWDRNYSETRLPAVPSAILETMSHQNFPDMLLGQDPNFKFDFARSLYKTIARYINGMHGHPTIIEPLAPSNIAVELNGSQATISWNPQTDPQEPSAYPTGYILYTAKGKGGFDNGTVVNNTSAKVDLEPGIVYRFRVSATNQGGESFPTPVAAAVYEPKATKTILVINGFNRLSPPAVINDSSRQGFDLNSDIGVSYGLTAGWNGRQLNFDKTKMGTEGPNGLGYSSNELAGQFIAGNDFTYAATHVEAIASAHQYNVVSCMSNAVESGKVSLSHYAAVDLLLGLERYQPTAVKYYKTFTSSMQHRLSSYTQGGGRLLVSGAYLASDMSDNDEVQWLRKTLRLLPGGSVKTDSISGFNGMGLNGIAFYKKFNSQHYAVQQADCLLPESPAACVMQYSDGSSAAVAYDGNDYKTFAMGFPFESICDDNTRSNIMRGILAFLLK